MNKNILIVGCSGAGIYIGKKMKDTVAAFEKHKLIIETMDHSFVSTAEAAERFRKAIIGLSCTPMRGEEPEELKKPVFFQRDIVPRKKRRFGK